MRTPPPLPTEAILDPYIGLRPYTDSDDDRARLFGREQDQEIIIANLYAARLTVFYGASGVGKSSVLLAGVVPELRETPRFACFVFRTWQSEKVLPALKEAILGAGTGGGEKGDQGRCAGRLMKGTLIPTANAARFSTIITRANRYSPIVSPIAACIAKMQTSQKNRVFFIQMKTG